MCFRAEHIHSNASIFLLANSVIYLRLERIYALLVVVDIIINLIHEVSGVVLGRPIDRPASRVTRPPVLLRVGYVRDAREAS